MALMETLDDVPFVRLPLELRLQIYALAIGPNDPIHIGTHAPAASHLHPWPVQPAVTRTSKPIRSEALQVFFATTSFVIHLQSREGFEMALKWVNHSASTGGCAFNCLRHITIITGSGLVERPKEIELDLTLARTVSVRVQSPASHEAAAQGPAFDQLNMALEQLSTRRRSELEMGRWMEGVIQACGAMLEEDEKEDRGVGEYVLGL